VEEIFTKSFKDLDGIDNLIKNVDAKYYIDTIEINKRMLLETGLIEEKIIDSEICTVQNCDIIHSYRGNNRTELRNTAIMGLI